MPLYLVPVTLTVTIDVEVDAESEVEAKALAKAADIALQIKSATSIEIQPGNLSIGKPRQKL